MHRYRHCSGWYSYCSATLIRFFCASHQFSPVIGPVNSSPNPTPWMAYSPAAITALVTIQTHTRNHCPARYPFTPGREGVIIVPSMRSPPSSLTPTSIAAKSAVQRQFSEVFCSTAFGPWTNRTSVSLGSDHMYVTSVLWLGGACIL